MNINKENEKYCLELDEGELYMLSLASSLLKERMKDWINPKAPIVSFADILDKAICEELRKIQD